MTTPETRCSRCGQPDSAPAHQYVHGAGYHPFAPAPPTMGVARDETLIRGAAAGAKRMDAERIAHLAREATEQGPLVRIQAWELAALCGIALRSSPVSAADGALREAERVIRNAALLMSSRLEGATISESYVAAYRLLFLYLNPESRVPPSVAANDEAAPHHNED